MNSKIYTISRLTREIKEILEDSFPPVWVEGEISNFTHHVSGHMYFTLKDEQAQIRCVMFRQYNYRLVFKPLNGINVLAFGALSVYERNGQYQLLVEQLKPAGIGDLQIAFEQLKRELDEEGLFDDGLKKPLPMFPKVIGIVTSPTGAVIRDMISVITRRFPPAKIVVKPVRVQGEGAGNEIAHAIEEFAEWGVLDVLIVGRGGGSLEDLWAFNEETVVRAIFNCEIPVISAVGHETDYTLADLVADVRAPTPSVAGEYVVPNRAETTSEVLTKYEQIINLQERHLGKCRQALDYICQNYNFRRPIDFVREGYPAIDQLRASLVERMQYELSMRRSECTRLAGMLDALSPLTTLERGFSVTYVMPEKILLKDAANVSQGDDVKVQLSKGELDCEVTKVIN